MRKFQQSGVMHFKYLLLSLLSLSLLLLLLLMLLLLCYSNSQMLFAIDFMVTYASSLLNKITEITST